MSLDDFIGKEVPAVPIKAVEPIREEIKEVAIVEQPPVNNTIAELSFINQVIHGDCVKVMDGIPSKTFDLIVTDPPYLIDYKTNHRADKEHDFCTAIQGDTDKLLIMEYIKQCWRILKQDSAMYIFCSADRADFFKQELQKWFTIKNMIIWVKNNWTAGDLDASFGRQYEIIFLVNKGRKKINGKRITDIWNFDRIVGKEQVHQNQKPVDLLMQCIEKHSNEGDLIFDGFGGSGSTAIACIKTKRNYCIVEKEEPYINIIKERISKGE